MRMFSQALLAAVLCLGAFPAAVRAEEGYHVVPGALISAVSRWVNTTGLVKADDKTAYGPMRLIAVGIQPATAEKPVPEAAMARVAYLALDPKTQEPLSETPVEFEIKFQWAGEKGWVYTSASQVAQAEGKETLTAVTCFNPPPPKPKLGVLAGEEGKPVQTTKSGLQYVVLEEGKGAKPAKGATITAEYTGWLAADGTQFDSSKDSDEAFEFAVGEGNVIPGWDEALLDMMVGERRKLIIPPALAYGEGGAGNVIPPHATLVFEVKLVAIR